MLVSCSLLSQRSPAGQTYICLTEHSALRTTRLAESQVPLLGRVGRSIAFPASFVWKVHVKAQAETLKMMGVGPAGASPSRSAVANRWSVGV